jgi:hypothetical protein
VVSSVQLNNPPDTPRLPTDQSDLFQHALSNAKHNAKDNAKDTGAERVDEDLADLVVQPLVDVFLDIKHTLNANDQNPPPPPSNNG